MYQIAPNKITNNIAPIPYPDGTNFAICDLVKTMSSCKFSNCV